MSHASSAEHHAADDSGHALCLEDGACGDHTEVDCEECVALLGGCSCPGCIDRRMRAAGIEST